MAEVRTGEQYLTDSVLHLPVEGVRFHRQHAPVGSAGPFPSYVAEEVRRRSRSSLCSTMASELGPSWVMANHHSFVFAIVQHTRRIIARCDLTVFRARPSHRMKTWYI